MLFRSAAAGAEEAWGGGKSTAADEREGGWRSDHRGDEVRVVHAGVVGVVAESGEEERKVVDGR